ncbi:MAG TPA: PAS domain-containing protein [Candidatus Thermoplasmatota archaeon]|nr:PAS domain-containing protein [Candidatus Thermoplasmatota archaeon]
MQPGDDRLLALMDSKEAKAHLGVPGTVVFIVRRDGHVLWVSPTVEAVLGHRPADVVGRNGWNLFVAKEDVHALAEFAAQLSEGDLTAWVPILHADKSKAWFRVDALNREGGLVVAYRHEPDPAQHHFHSMVRPIPAAQRRPM